MAKLEQAIDNTLLILVSLSSLLIDSAVYQLNTRKQMYLHNITALLSGYGPMPDVASVSPTSKLKKMKESLYCIRFLYR